MVIGITQRVVVNQFGEVQDALDQRWFALARALKITLVPIPNALKNPVAYLKQFSLEGVIFSGGNDVIVKSLAPEVQQKLNTAPERDRTEGALLQYALENTLPVLGVCRGAQFINVFFDGGLIALKAEEHVAREHNVYWVNNEFIAVDEPLFSVNSYHNFGVDYQTLAKSCLVLATTENKEVEAFHHKTAPILGLLWHPERYTQLTPHDLSILSQFFKRS
ncbi:MAG: gamma-glutamyl-gamma-aminobutyrate hydrolase family protein [Schleiferiaceae bacterium]|nr:gamma-glutamyl-gamma-aminobutyrate hydrolase family protein [Schleiferiaceae bacterium]